MSGSFLELLSETPSDGSFATSLVRNSLAAAASKYEDATPDQIADALDT